MAGTAERLYSNFQSTLTEDVRVHLKNVYGCLALSAIAAAAGAYLLTGGFLSAVAGFGCILGLLLLPDNNGKNRKLRFLLLIGFAISAGMGLAPLMNYAMVVDKTLVVSAFSSTAVLFTCFSLSALVSRRGEFLYLGGILSTLLIVLLVLSLTRVIFASVFMHQCYLFLGIIAMCGFILYDTQMIVEKRMLGDTDYVSHALDLFVDMLDMFRFLLVLLTDKEQRRQNSKRKD